MANLQKLSQLRKQVERIDKAILKKLGERFSVTSEIQELKKTLKMPATQSKREKELLDAYLELGKELGVPKLLISRFYTEIFSFAKKYGNMKRWNYRKTSKKVKSQ
ncbi:hypothetical protein COV82_06665 [Candidatus Peregrinibacteria bacterium CG11_big_fil_rev_8_21_14_0_20_46_8]|nr:MAG: hypothetical protein COV82_06665 [Candidatus Peregrinibacteria bacterium CG11_big_fil_rev_8_21_14_0_20_46_8]